MFRDVITRSYAEVFKMGSVESRGSLSSVGIPLFMGGDEPRDLLHRSSNKPMQRNTVELISPQSTEERPLELQAKEERERGKRRNRGREGGQTKKKQQRIEQEEKATKKSPQAKRERKERKISDSHMHTNSETHCTPLLADKQRKKQPRSKEQRKR
jgi:hypothetical protein